MKKIPIEEAKKVIDRHRVSVTVSRPEHPMVSRRKETEERVVKIRASSIPEALEKAKKFYKKGGYKVHDANHIEQWHED